MSIAYSSEPINQLTEAELQQLWKTVPFHRQQREEMIRIRLRPELPANYSGPVELSDLRLAASPWLWAKGELGTSSRTKALNKALAEAQAANKHDELDDVPSVVQWLLDKLKGFPEVWDLFPNDIDFWEDCGTFKLMTETNVGTFVPMDVEFSAVFFFPESRAGADPWLVVAQTYYDSGEQVKWGPAGIYTCSQRVADNNMDPLGWLFTSDALKIVDPETGECALLMPCSPDEDVDEEAQEQGKRISIEPCFADAKNGLLAKTQAPSWISGRFYYQAGLLYRSDRAKQALTFDLHLPSK